MATLFANGKIWQWTDGGHAFADWMLVAADGAILQLGTGAEPSEVAAAAREDLGGALVLPGLHDSHIHAYYMGESDEFLNLSGCASFEDFADRLRKYDAAFPDKAWIVGFGWEQDTLSPSARYPSRHDIDAVVRGRPVLLHRACWHIAAVNTKALEIAGVDVSAASHVVESGSIDTDESGATGILRESVRVSRGGEYAEQWVLSLTLLLPVCRRLGSLRSTRRRATMVRACAVALDGLGRQLGLMACVFAELRMKYLRNAMNKCARYGLTGT